MQNKKNSINLDQLVDYRAEYGSVVGKPKIIGDMLTGLCPFHDDQKASFSVDLKTGKWHCFAEDKSGNFLTFYAKLHNVDTKEAYKQILEKYGAWNTTDQKKTLRTNTDLKPYTVEQYSTDKHLPVEWLEQDCNVQTKKDKKGILYVCIPYFNAKQEQVVYRKRYAEKNFRWERGKMSNLCMYGLWKMESIHNDGYVILVEGESDSQTLWYMGISALGIPGASMMRSQWVNDLKGLKVYIHVEPDKGGETFFEKVVQALCDGDFQGEVHKWSCVALGCKDPSELYIKYGSESVEKIKNLLSNAQLVDIHEVDSACPEVLKDAPAKLRQPAGWIISEKGIEMIDEKKQILVLVCRTPIIISRRICRMDTGLEKVEIAFKRDGKWQTAIYPRSTVFTARTIVVMADLGCTVTSENAKLIVRFLSALEAENIDRIPKVDSTSTFGWQPGGKFIPGHGDGIVLDIDPSQKAMAAAYCKSGTMDEWVELVEPYRDNDKFRFILAASFTAPLLKIIRQRIFFVYNWAGSKAGKTAALKAALSVWGDPERLMVNFNTTQVGLERTAAFYCDLPLGIDERQLAGNNQNALERIVYMIASGTGKTRGAKTGGIQATQTWRTVALATGEEPLSTETSQTGVSTRVVEVYGAPFDDEKSASLMHQQSTLHFGWAGSVYIDMLLHMDEASIVEIYDEMTQYVSEISGEKSRSHIAGIAAVALADALIDMWIFGDEKLDVKEHYSLKINPESLLRAQRMAKAIIQGQMNIAAGDVNENALQFIVDWILSHKENFEETTQKPRFGMIENNNVYILPSILTSVLTDAGYSPRKTTRYLAEKKLIGVTVLKDGSTKNSVVKRYDGRSCRFVEFHLGSVEKAMSLEEEKNMQQFGAEEPFLPIEVGEEIPF